MHVCGEPVHLHRHTYFSDREPRESFLAIAIYIRLSKIASPVDVVSPAANEGGLEHGRSKARSHEAKQTRKMINGHIAEIGQETKTLDGFFEKRVYRSPVVS